MKKENGMIILYENEFNAHCEHVKNLDKKIHDAEEVIQELSNVLLERTRDDEIKTEDIKLSMRAFLKLYNSCFNIDENGKDHVESDLYDHDVCVHWHGFYCSCYDGASAFNNIIDGIKAVMDEYE